MTGDLMKRGSGEADLSTGRTPCEDEGKGQSEVSAAKDPQRLPTTPRS